MALLNAVALSTSPFASVSPLRYNSKGNLDFRNVSVTKFQAKPSSRAPLIRCYQEDKIIKIESSDRELRRSDFPDDFLFGASSSALQTEGVNGRGESMWDKIMPDCHAIDSYHRYKDDVQMLKGMSANCYRFSISWSRILPKGTLAEGCDSDGIEFYNHFIDELVSNGITPIVTLLHYDLPQALIHDYKGFLGNKIVADFTDYANICFKNFGDRVKLWTTFNEPQVISGKGIYAVDGIDDKARMPYKCAHNIILAHASAAKLYRETYKASQKGEIGFPTCVQWFLPYNDTPGDRDAAKRAKDFFQGWYLEPLITGDYPFSMKAIVGERLPRFSEEEKEMVKNSIDFITINYYTSRYAKAEPFDRNPLASYENDQHLTLTPTDPNGNDIGPLADGDHEAYQAPKLLKNVLLDLKNHYGNPKTYISENGVMEQRNDEIPRDEQLHDLHRIKYVQDHLESVRDAILEEANVKGYCMWSLNDSLELGEELTYNVRMGFNYIDYLDNLKRIPKESAKWYNNFLSKTEPDPEA